MSFSSPFSNFFSPWKKTLKNTALAALTALFFLATGPSAWAKKGPPTPPVHPALGAVATTHPLATQTAVKILRRGGNAIDAAVGAALTLAVVEPYYSGLGAGGLAILWDGKNHKVAAFDFREKAPLASEAGMFLQPGWPADASENGPLAIAVPGEIDGLASLHRQGGHLPWKELFSDAIQLAETGFVPDAGLLLQVENKKECLRRDYHTAQIYQPLWSTNGSTVKWQQPALAQTLKQLAEAGPEVFYRGPLGASLVKDLQGKGALLTERDLAEYQTIQRDPLSAKFSWGQLWSFPLPSSGGISLIRGLQTMEALDKMAKDKTPAKDWMPWMVQVLGQLFQTRNAEMGDGDFNPHLPVKKWISKDFAKKQAKEILHSSSGTSQNFTSQDSGHTTHLSVIDAEGNAIAMTLTQNLAFGSCVTSGETGLLMNDQMDDFSTRPGQPNHFGLVQSEANAIAPGKRPLSSMTPTLVTQKGRVLVAIGTPGGPKIISTLLQVLYRRFILGESLSEAMAAPRFHYQGIPNEIFVEEAGQPSLTAALQILKLPIVTAGTWCDVQAISFDPQTEAYSAFSDPRGQGKAVVVYPEPGLTNE